MKHAFILFLFVRMQRVRQEQESNIYGREKESENDTRKGSL